MKKDSIIVLLLFDNVNCTATQQIYWTPAELKVLNKNFRFSQGWLIVREKGTTKSCLLKVDPHVLQTTNRNKSSNHQVPESPRPLCPQQCRHPPSFQKEIFYFNLLRALHTHFPQSCHTISAANCSNCNCNWKLTACPTNEPSPPPLHPVVLIERSSCCAIIFNICSLAYRTVGTVGTARPNRTQRQSR